MINNQITLYKTADGKIKIDVLFENENLWLTQKLMAELFECGVDNISLHLKNIFESGELEEKGTIEEYSIVQKEGNREVKRKKKMYNLEAIISVGYRINSNRGTEFRIWATKVLKNYILKGFAIDKERFINGTKFDLQFFDELMEEIREKLIQAIMYYYCVRIIISLSVPQGYFLWGISYSFIKSKKAHF